FQGIPGTKEENKETNTDNNMNRFRSVEQVASSPRAAGTSNIDGLVVEVCSTFATTETETVYLPSQHKRNASLMLGPQETETTATTGRSASLEGERQEQTGFLGRFFASTKKKKNSTSRKMDQESRQFQIQEIAIGAETRDEDIDDSSIYDSTSDNEDDESDISISSSQSHLYDASTMGDSRRKGRGEPVSHSMMSYWSEEESRDDRNSSIGSSSSDDDEDDDDTDASEYSSDEDESLTRLKASTSGDTSEKTTTMTMKQFMGHSDKVKVRAPVAQELRDAPEVMRSISEDTPTPAFEENEQNQKKRWLPWRGFRKQQRKFLFVSPKLDPIRESPLDDDGISSMVEAMSFSSSPSKRSRARMMGTMQSPEREMPVPRKKAKSAASPKEALGAGWEITSFKQKKPKAFWKRKRAAQEDQEFVITVRTAQMSPTTLSSP
ncbi:MAG: hypothetical protein SGILL_003363, partial [Bacillariaceae sp.]